MVEAQRLSKDMGRLTDVRAVYTHTHPCPYTVPFPMPPGPFQSLPASLLGSSWPRCLLFVCGVGCGGCGLFPGPAGPCLRDCGSGRGEDDIVLLAVGCGHCCDAPVAAAGAAGHTEGATTTRQHCCPEAGNEAGRRGWPHPGGQIPGTPNKGQKCSCVNTEKPQGLVWGWGGCQLPLLPAGHHHQAPASLCQTTSPQHPSLVQVLPPGS